MTVLDFLTDPVMQAPTLGSMLMCLASSLIGVIVFIRKRSLLGEALSHAAYPGVVISVILSSLLFPFSEEIVSINILIGAFVSSLIGLVLIDLMERRLKVKSDAALCFILSVFFGFGILVASKIQLTHALWYQQIQLFLYGQTATMTDIHIVIYSILAGLMLLSLALLYRLIEVTHFDRSFAQSIGIRIFPVDAALFFLLVLAIVIGIRSVGVVLMSGMLIAPAVAARQWTHRLSHLFILAGCFGIASGFLGNYFSVLMPQWVNPLHAKTAFSLPTGPMILLSAVAFALVSLLLAPGSGVISRMLRAQRFKARCQTENILKAFWHKKEGGCLSFAQIAHAHKMARLPLFICLQGMRLKGWLQKTCSGMYCLTQKGQEHATRIVRLHRLWEVYLVSYLGQGAEKVHHTAEEMEHLLNPELEKELTELLGNPRRDPHHREIP